MAVTMPRVTPESSHLTVDACAIPPGTGASFSRTAVRLGCTNETGGGGFGGERSFSLSGSPSPPNVPSTTIHHTEDRAPSSAKSVARVCRLKVLFSNYLTATMLEYSCNEVNLIIVEAFLTPAQETPGSFDTWLRVRADHNVADGIGFYRRADNPLAMPSCAAESGP
jgi:hypothetical protein